MDELDAGEKLDGHREDSLENSIITDKRQTGKFNYHGQNEEKGFPSPS